MGAVKADRLAGTENTTTSLFWSPDSRFIGFQADGKLKKINIAGGPPSEIGDADGVGPGSWSSDGIILYSRNLNGSPVIVGMSDSGGEVKPVTEPSLAQGLQLLPQFLPDNRHFLFHAVGRPGARRPGEASVS